MPKYRPFYKTLQRSSDFFKMDLVRFYETGCTSNKTTFIQFIFRVSKIARGGGAPIRPSMNTPLIGLIPRSALSILPLPSPRPTFSPSNGLTWDCFFTLLWYLFLGATLKIALQGGKGTKYFLIWGGGGCAHFRSWCHFLKAPQREHVKKLAFSAYASAKALTPPPSS